MARSELKKLLRGANKRLLTQVLESLSGAHHVVDSAGVSLLGA